MADVYTNPEKHVVLHNNVKMPILGLGTSHNGGYSHDAVVSALKDCGYRHIDTAKRYGCEEYIAQAIKESNVDREEVFLATKCWPTDYGKEKIIDASKGSCERLDTSYLDLYLLHWPDVPTGYNRKQLITETWRALELLYEKDTVRAIGISNFLEHHLESLLEDCSIVPHVNQCEFHPFNNPIALRQMCADNNIQFEGYSPLAKGRILSSNFLTDLSREVGRTPSQILIRWSFQNNVPTIPKSTKCDRVFENAQIFDFELSSEDMNLLNSRPQCFTVIDRSSIQEKIDNPQPDGYKLKFIKVPPKIVS